MGCRRDPETDLRARRGRQRRGFPRRGQSGQRERIRIHSSGVTDGVLEISIVGTKEMSFIHRNIFLRCFSPREPVLYGNCSREGGGETIGLSRVPRRFVGSSSIFPSPAFLRVSSSPPDVFSFVRGRLVRTEGKNILLASFELAIPTGTRRTVQPRSEAWAGSPTGYCGI